MCKSPADIEKYEAGYAAVMALHDNTGERWIGFPRADIFEVYCKHCRFVAPCPTVFSLDPEAAKAMVIPTKPDVVDTRIRCGHSGCRRMFAAIVGFEEPDHAEFQGKTHDCCLRHKRGKRLTF